MTDQVAGIRRILEEIIAPELREGYPSQVLRGVVKNLSMLQNAWPAVLPFLLWDVGVTRDLLEDAEEVASPELRRRIEGCLSQSVPTGSVDELDRHLSDLRELLSETIRELSGRDGCRELLGHITEHLRARTRRYPFRMAIAAPTSAKNKDR